MIAQSYRRALAKRDPEDLRPPRPCGARLSPAVCVVAARLLPPVPAERAAFRATVRKSGQQPHAAPATASGSLSLTYIHDFQQ
jgi:hypothetical protein